MFKITKDLKTFVHILNIIFVTFLLSMKPNSIPKVTKIHRLFEDMKHILLWDHIQDLEEEGQKVFIEGKCQKYNCYVTKNKSLLGDTRYFDAILFNLQESSRGHKDLPKFRSWTQKFVFFANDSSDNFPVCSNVYDDFFNWTWTYRMGSTIHYGFISLYNLEGQWLGSHFPKITILKKIDRLTQQRFVSKSKAAVVFLDQCKTKSKREDYISDLKYQLKRLNLTLDVFGDCGTRQCKKKYMTPCYWRLKKDYYFYLAFEDSFAEDYVTDMVLTGYDHNAVPIVRGGADYKEFLPPKSYIDASYKTAEDLATQIHKIINYRKRYFDMFRWTNHYAIKKSKTMDPCKLCAALNQASWLSMENQIPDFRKWWNPYYKERCGLVYRNLFFL